MKLIFIVIASCYLTCCQSQKENWKLVPYETQVSYLTCSTNNYESCFWLIFIPICSWDRVIRCVVDYRTETRNLRMCKDGWTNLPLCLTPICEPRCRTGETCTAPNKCECLSTGGVCTNVPCSESQICYPGTCNQNKTCSCHQDFYGNDCQFIRRTPTDIKCEVTIQTPTQMNLKTSCAPSNKEPEIKWVNSITNIVLHLESTYDPSGLNLPDSTVANYVKYPYSLGISKIGYSMNFTSASGSRKSAYNYTCLGYSTDAPVSHATCDIVKPYQDTGLPSLSLNDTLQIYVLSKLGGYVEGNKNPNIGFSSFYKRLFLGDEANSSSIFKIDNESPVHCLNDPNANCPFFPIHLENDITTERTIYPQFLGWTDSASGIASYHIEVYLLRPSVTNTLVNTGDPILVRNIKSTENNIAITSSTPGVYSIELTVYDQVNNNASARNIFIYSDKNGIKTNPDKPLQVKEAVKIEENKNEWWITDVSKLSSNTITISWDGHCSSNGQFNDEWTLPVNPWNKGIDDIPYKGRSYGPRTIEEYKGLKKGIYSYSISSYIGPRSEEQFTQTANYNSTTNSANINYAKLKDGTTLNVQFSCADMSGGRISEKLFINVDTSSAIVANATFQKNYPDIYTSSVNLWIEEKDSGIKSINYKIFLGSNNNNNPLISQSIAPKTRDAPNANKGRKKREALEGPCTVDDKSCYCTPLGLCYDYYQSVGIDHCLIDRVNNNDFYFDVTVNNLAGLTSSVRRIKMEDMKDLECRPANRLTSGQIAAIVICVLILVFILAVIMFLLLRIYLFKKPVPRPLSNAYVSVISKIRRRNEEAVSSPNDLYISGCVYEKKSECNKDDYKDYNNVYTKLRLPENSITLKEELSKGKLMMVNKAIFNNKGSKEAVVVKYLKNGSTSKSKEFFGEKIKFHGDLTPHENIVKFLGICEKPQGPMMVMEYCELPLKTWLSGLGEITPDNLDDMCTTSLNVASGVEHLHKRKIIHKRLLVKNVLLTMQFSQYVAKLIGFGPDKHEDNADAKASVPIKWLAPETLDTITDSQPTYDEKTDVWTYGILLWEMYTKAISQPYPELRSNEAKNAIIKGAKMSRPDYCPPLIFEHVMTKCWSTDPLERPTFSKISSELEAYKSSCSDSTGYYAPA